MRTLRRQKKLSQRGMAYHIGCSQSYIAQVERAHRPPSWQLAQRYEEVFELEPGTYTNNRFLRGRPALTAQSKAVQKDLREAVPMEPAFDYDPRKPRYPLKDVTYGLDNAFGAMKSGDPPGDDLARLMMMRPEDGRFWRQANLVRYDSFSEKRFAVKVALTGGQLTGVGYEQSGCTFQMVSGKSGRPYKRRAPAAFLLKVDDVSMALYPQRCVRTEPGHRWPDYIIVAAYQGRRRTMALEVNGPIWHQDQRRERKRDRELGVPVYHLCASQIENPETLKRIFSWVRSQLNVA